MCSDNGQQEQVQDQAEVSPSLPSAPVWLEISPSVICCPSFAKYLFWLCFSLQHLQHYYSCGGEEKKEERIIGPLGRGDQPCFTCGAGGRLNYGTDTHPLQPNVINALSPKSTVAIVIVMYLCFF